MKKMSFEAAMKRLDEIVMLLEQGDVLLEKSLALFEEGTKLAAFCNEALQTAEIKITELSFQKPNERQEGE